MISLRRYLPSAALRGLVTSFYVVEGRLPAGVAVEDVVLPEVANLRITLEGSWSGAYRGDPAPIPEIMIAGASTRPFRHRSVGRCTVFGAGLTALGWARCVGIPAREMTDKVCDGRPVLGENVELLAERLKRADTDEARVSLAEAFFRKCAAERADPSHGRLAKLDEMSAGHDGKSVEGLAGTFALSTRQLERWMLDVEGCSPKTYLRKHRFLRAVEVLESSEEHNWMEAAGLAFYDQSHFIREFKRFAGDTPRAYFSRKHEIWSHVSSTRRALERLREIENTGFVGLRADDGGLTRLGA